MVLNRRNLNGGKLQTFGKLINVQLLFLCPTLSTPEGEGQQQKTYKESDFTAFGFCKVCRDRSRELDRYSDVAFQQQPTSTPLYLRPDKICFRREPDLSAASYLYI